MLTSRRNVLGIALALALTGMLTPAVAEDGAGATLDQLSWMTGDWRGELGNGAWIEERWSQVAGKSLVSAVRMVGGGKTNMLEFIVIEEEADGIVLRLQQWNAGFKPRSPEPMVMKLKEVEEGRVLFVNEGATEGMATLGYAHPAHDQFEIHVTMVGATQANVLKLSVLE